ncbi:MAG: hypothetical protein JWM95_5290 [Gemmatimonadetes bacterium]|nr:hypothetical protein [Gemmatimonadota bacterium]
MGSLTSLTLDGYEILSTRSCVDLTSTTLFREDDKRVQPAFSTGRGAIVSAPWMRLPEVRAAVQYGDGGSARFVLPDHLEWSEQRTTAADTEYVANETPTEDWEEVTMGHAYIAPVATVRDRLEVMGFTLPAAQNEFERGVRARLDELASWMQSDSEQEVFAKEHQALVALTFPAWLEAFRFIKSRGAHRVADAGDLSRETYGGYLLPASDATSTVGYLLDEGTDHRYGLPIQIFVISYAPLSKCVPTMR